MSRFEPKEGLLVNAILIESLVMFRRRLGKFQVILVKYSNWFENYRVINNPRSSKNIVINSDS